MAKKAGKRVAIPRLMVDAAHLTDVAWLIAEKLAAQAGNGDADTHFEEAVKLFADAHGKSLKPRQGGR